MRIAEADVDRILEILQAIPERKIRFKQAHLGHVFHRWAVQRGKSLGVGAQKAAAAAS